MGARVHHTAICVRDVEASARFYRDGLGLQELMAHDFEGDWPTLFGAATSRLSSVFLGDPGRPDAGIVELVVFDGADRADRADGVGERVPPVSGFFLVSFFVDVDDTLERLARLGHTDVRRIEQPGPRGDVSMATVRDPDGVLVELIDRGQAR
jgi:catechol 2,3-dioxygenase-like lactoylglutathione lyase family enzyme